QRVDPLVTAQRGPHHIGDFTFDPTSGDLVGPAGRIRLTPQVAMLLELLAERAGAVVARAELKDKLWPDTALEFDGSLNFTVRQLRRALGDDVGTPRYIETLPRRGYRLVASVRDASNRRNESGRPRVAEPLTRGRWRRIQVTAVGALTVMAISILLQRG